MDQQLKSLMDVFKVTEERDLVKAKSEGHQIRYTMHGKKPKLVKLSEEQVKKLCEKAGIEYQSGYEHRILSGVTTDETPDRYGDIVRFNGVEFANYTKNPVVLLSHEHGNFPVGNSLKIWQESSVKGIMSYDLYMDERVDTSGRADLSFKMRQSGLMPGISIGFVALKTKTDHSEDERKKTGLGRWGIEFLSIDYLEHSQVSVPANPSALTNAIKSMGQKALTSTFEKADLFRLEDLKFFNDVELLNILEYYIKGNNTTIITAGGDGTSCNTLSIDETVDKILKSNETVNMSLEKVITSLTSVCEKLDSSIASNPSNEEEDVKLYSDEILGLNFQPTLCSPSTKGEK